MVLGLLFAAWVEKPWMVDSVSSNIRSRWYVFVSFFRLVVLKYFQRVGETRVRTYSSWV